MPFWGFSILHANLAPIDKIAAGKVGLPTYLGVGLQMNVVVQI